jgi:putative zinc finger/helix-turn-helix YgiT family protein
MEKNMNCSNCGKAMSSGHENVKYDACGLSYVTLVDVEVRRCSACGEYEVVIPRMEELHRTLARAVACRAERLGCAEIKFLRKFMGLNSASAAEELMVAPETMSRWETGKAQMSEMAEKLLRVLVFNRDPAESYPEMCLKKERRPKRSGQIMLKRDTAWHQMVVHRAHAAL